MKKSMVKLPFTYFIFTVLLVTSLSLISCNTGTPQSAPDQVEVEQAEAANEVTLPIIAAEPEEDAETEAQDQASQDAEQDTQNTEFANSPQDEAASDSQQENQAQDDADSHQEEIGSTSAEAESSPQDEVAQEPVPTPRGDELVATNPATVKLASGGLQLVELFTFW